jgi:hypothetical protein
MDSNALLRLHAPVPASVGATATADGPNFGWLAIVIAAGAGFALGTWNRNPLEGPKGFAEDTSKGLGKLHQKIEDHRAARR